MGASKGKMFALGAMAGAVLVVGGATISMAMGGDGDVRGSSPEVPGPTSEATTPTESSVVPDGGQQTATGVAPTLAPVASTPAFERTVAGARTAAVGYLEATEEAILLSPIEAAAMQRTMATTEFAEEFGSDTEQRMTELLSAVPVGITLRVAPIEARTVADDDGWLVSIWYVQAITISGESVVDDWRTANYRMRWQDGTWKIAAFDSDREPMPGRGTQPPSVSPEQFETILAGFSDTGLS
ncbi:MAG: hypothetical protein ACI8Y4_004264 [Candidatus Poriferisodalaceae bacterium]|jgi:hypothetical protein